MDAAAAAAAAVATASNAAGEVILLFWRFGTRLLLVVLAAVDRVAIFLEPPKQEDWIKALAPLMVVGLVCWLKD